jgi:MFS family permease
MTRTERTYYVVNAGWCVSWAVGPVYPLFLRSRGLDLFEANLVFAVFLATNFLFEVPTGAVADLAGRKVSFILACVVRTVAFTRYAFAENFTDFVVAEVIDAIGQTLASGALEAWAVDGVRSEGDHRPTDRMFARAQIVARSVMIGGGIGFGYVADLDIRLIWFVGAANYAITGIVASLLMHEPRSAKAARWHEAHRSVARTAVDGFRAVRDTPVVATLCVLAMLIGFSIMPLNMLWPSRLRELSSEGYWLVGWVWAGLSFSVILGGAAAPRLLDVVGRSRLVWLSVLLRSVGLLVAALATGFAPVAGGLLLAYFGMGAGVPSIGAWLNEHIESKRRATVLSVGGMAFTLGGAIGLVVLGLIARGQGIEIAWLVGSATLGAAALGYRLLGRATRPMKSAGLAT